MPTLWEILRKHDLPLDKAQWICNEAMLANVMQATWEPIETSPRDGAPFMGYLGGLKVPYFICWWGTSIRDGKPYICIYGLGELWDHKLFPTHWQPLPEPPRAAEPPGGE